VPSLRQDSKNLHGINLESVFVSVELKEGIWNIEILSESIAKDFLLFLYRQSLKFQFIIKRKCYYPLFLTPGMKQQNRLFWLFRF